MKILIVDDDPIVIQSCCRILEAEAIEVHIASTVEMGEEILVEKNYDLMLTDIKMPGKDGFEMIQRAREIRPDMPVLIMTGYLTSETVEKSRRFGVNNYIAKPFTPEELIASVRNAR